MDEKNKMKDFLKLYQKFHNEEWKRGIGIEKCESGFLTRDEFTADREKTFDKFIAGKPVDKQIHSFLTHFCGYSARPLYIFGLREAFSSWDMQHLQNVIYQSSRAFSAGKRTLSSGWDHCINIWIAIKAFAANDLSLAKSIIPKELGLSKNGWAPMITGVNLLMSLFYKDDKMLEEAKKSAYKLLSGKQTLFHKSIVEYLLALAENDILKASESLKQVCEGTRKVGDSAFISKLDKCFCVYAHGLYNFAYFVLSQEDFSRLKQPDDKGFINELAGWNIKNGFSKGELYFPMPGKLSLQNVILQTDQPETKLVEKADGSKMKFFTDTKSFLVNFTERVLDKIEV